MQTDRTAILNHAQAEYDAGRQPWAYVQAAQASILPECKAHKEACSIVFQGEPLCPKCIKGRTQAIIEASRKPSDGG